MNLSSRLARLVTVLLVLAGGNHAAYAEPLRIFYFNWAGYGPFFLAQEKGVFAAEGLPRGDSDVGTTLLEAKRAPHGHLLTDSSERPGLLTSCLFE